MTTEIKTKSDEEIVLGCLEYNKQYQYEFFRRFYGRLKSVCARYITDMDTVNDIVQEGFIKAFNKLHTLKNPAIVYSWIKTMIVNLSIDYLRKNKMYFENIDEIEQNCPELLDEEIEYLKNNVSTEKILMCINKMTPAYRLIMNMHIDGIQHKNIAEKLNISIGTSKSNLSKAKIQLKKLILSEYRENDVIDFVNKL
jgi:RNA polymerase sigma factor (sigma-70 family)